MRYQISISGNKRNPSHSKAVITLDKKPVSPLSERLLYWGFKVDKSGKKLEAVLADLSNKNPNVWESFLRYYDGKPAKNGLGEPYIPVSEQGFVLETHVPDTMSDETHIAARKIKKIVGGNIFQFVKEKLGYKTDAELEKALAAEQIDAVALAIYNIEQRRQSLIVGDQTGIGKGRVAAAMIRYANKQGKIPIFISEKPNLFSDIYRDLADIGSSHLVPFIVNANEAKTKVKNDEGTILYEPDPIGVQADIFKSQKLPKKYDVVLATYSQFNQPEKKPIKPLFLAEIAHGSIIIMDEAHNASGDSQTGGFLMSTLGNADGVVFLSATFAKTPKNMPIYAIKTCMSEANMTKAELIESIDRGGVALQEILSAQLVAEGQMIRRERTFEGIEVDYVLLDENAAKHAAIADKVTSIIRDIIVFQQDFVKEAVKDMDKDMKMAGGEATATKGTSNAGIDNQPYFSRVFNVVNQLLLSIKAEDVAHDAIHSLKAGRKPVIAFANTMGAFLEELAEVSGGEVISTDFKYVLYKGLASVLKITTTDFKGKKTHSFIEPAMLGDEAVAEYNRIRDEIDHVSTGITISPIDKIVQIIENAGFSVAEVTGRSIMVQFTSKDTGTIVARKKVATNDAFRKFNDNEVDCLLINQSGSTGASAHAVVTRKVPKEKVKQREMIVLQAELNINTEVQKRGRINRTGQILKPRYRYVSSAIPAENRLQMMLQRKLRSLDANTTSNQKANQSQMGKQTDFLNKYGDKVVADYLLENPEINEMLGSPLGEIPAESEGAAAKVSGRVAILSVQMQEKFYTEMAVRYSEYEEYLKQCDEYDLEVEVLGLDAIVVDEKVLKAGKGGKTAFGKDTMLRVCDCQNLKRPFTQANIEGIVSDILNGQNAMEYAEAVTNKMRQHFLTSVANQEAHINDKIEDYKANITKEKKYKKLLAASEKQAYIKDRTKEIEDSRTEMVQAEKDKANKLFQALYHRMNMFYPGRGVYFPAVMTSEYVPAIFLDFTINKNEANPYTLSKVKLRFAVGDGRKYMTLALSGDQGAIVDRIMGVSHNMSVYDQNIMLSTWTDLMKVRSADRVTRYIVSGNILQAASDYKGKLIEYTIRDGKVSEKGILMPEGWEADKGSSTVKVPIIKLLSYIKGLGRNGIMALTGGIMIENQGYRYKMVIPSGSKNKDLYTDQDLIALAVGTDGFNKVSGNMVAYFDQSDIERLVKVMQEKYTISVEMPRTMFEMIFGDDVSNRAIDTSTPEDKWAREQLRKDKASYGDRIGRKQTPKKSTGIALALAIAIEIELEMEFEF
jgi:phenylpyruvate tautomerase PptA (4-oxalocrotonate tautomerase family)